MSFGKKKQLAAALGLMTPLAFGVVMLSLDRYGQRDRARPAQAIVVLGASVNAYGFPGPSLRARTLHAVELYQRGYARKLICTGGVGRHPPAEARAAATLAVRHGVAPGDIFTEETSTSTWENISNAAGICRREGFKQVIVVSDPYHLWRARRNFAALGITAHPSPTANRAWPQRLRMTAREVFSVTRDLLFLR